MSDAGDFQDLVQRIRGGDEDAATQLVRRYEPLIRRAAGGEIIVILNRNREVAKIVPITSTTARTGGLVGCLAGTAEVRGDIEAPIAPAEVWFSNGR